MPVSMAVVSMAPDLAAASMAAAGIADTPEGLR
jgi:hypothetical protein